MRHLHHTQPSQGDCPTPNPNSLAISIVKGMQKSFRGTLWRGQAASNFLYCHPERSSCFASAKQLGSRRTPCSLTPSSGPSKEFPFTTSAFAQNQTRPHYSRVNRSITPRCRG